MPLIKCCECVFCTGPHGETAGGVSKTYYECRRHCPPFIEGAYRPEWPVTTPQHCCGDGERTVADD